MKNLDAISRLCDMAPRVELARIANTQRIKTSSNYLGRALYTDADAQAIVEAYWQRRKVSIQERAPTVVQERKIARLVDNHKRGF